MSEPASVEERVHKVELELAERRPVDKLIQLFVYFLAALSVVVGLFGFKQFSDMDTIISSEVKNQFPRDSQKYLEYKKLVDETEVLKNNYTDLFGKYEVALKAFAHLDKVTDDFDIEGKVTALNEDAEKRSEEERLDEKWRLQAVATLRLAAEAQKKRNFTSDFIFNVAQTARRLQQNALAYDLVKVAYSKRPNDAPIKAALLSTTVAIGDEKEIENAFSGLMNMVNNLDANSPQIVLSEAWNAAENLRRYGDLIVAIDRYLANKAIVGKPSYAYFMKAYALTRASRPGDLEAAKVTIRDGIGLLERESPNAVWYQASVRQYQLCLEVFANAGKAQILRKMGDALIRIDES